jgi:hypothetical protein
MLNDLSIIHRVASRYLLVSSGREAFKYEPKETKQHKAERVGDKIREATGLQKGTAFAIAEAHVRGRNVNSLAVQKDWPIEQGVIIGPKGEMPVSELSSLL